jgi:hypothetical protein
VGDVQREVAEPALICVLEHRREIIEASVERLALTDRLAEAEPADVEALALEEVR